VDLLISYWHLPKPSGIEVLRAMRRDNRLKHTPRLMITGTGTRKEIIEAAHAEVNGYLLKPSSARVLTQQLRKVLPSPASIHTTRSGQHYF